MKLDKGPFMSMVRAPLAVRRAPRTRMTGTQETMKAGLSESPTRRLRKWLPDSRPGLGTSTRGDAKVAVPQRSRACRIFDAGTKRHGRGESFAKPLSPLINSPGGRLQSIRATAKVAVAGNEPRVEARRQEMAGGAACFAGMRPARTDEG